MKITTFKNMKGLIHGSDPKRIGCDRAGVLNIGKEQINIIPDEDAMMPKLFNGGTGNYDAPSRTSRVCISLKRYTSETDGFSLPRPMPWRGWSCAAELTQPRKRSRSFPKSSIPIRLILLSNKEKRK